MVGHNCKGLFYFDRKIRIKSKIFVYQGVFSKLMFFFEDQEKVLLEEEPLLSQYM
jgi:hypothetical protein